MVGDVRWMCTITDIDALALSHKSYNVFRAKAVTSTTDLGEALVLEVGDAFLENGIDGFREVRVLAVTAFGHPSHEVEVARAIKREGVAVEEVDNEGVVAVSGELVGHQLCWRLLVLYH